MLGSMLNTKHFRHPYCNCWKILHIYSLKICHKLMFCALNVILVTLDYCNVVIHLIFSHGDFAHQKRPNLMEVVSQLSIL